MFFDFFVNFKEFNNECENNSEKEDKAGKKPIINVNAHHDDETDFRKKILFKSFSGNENQVNSSSNLIKTYNLMDIEDNQHNKGIIISQQAKLEEANDIYLKVSKYSNFSLSKVDLEFDNNRNFFKN